MKWALIGASDIAATRMIPAIRARGDQVTTVVSSTAEHAAKYAAANGIDHYHTDVAAALDTSLVDAVYISSRNDRHVEQALQAVSAAKHVLCEKPVALTIDEARSLLAALDRADTAFAVNHHLPGAPTHTAIRRLIAAGAIGTPLAVSVCHAVALPERLQGWRVAGGSGAGVVLDVTCHDASVINAALGTPASSATAVGVNQGPWPAGGAHDAVMTALTYGQVSVQTHDAFTIAYRPTRFDVFGTEGAILASDVMRQDPAGEVVLRTAAGEKVVDVGERRNLYAIVLDAFAEAVAGVGRPTVTATEGVNAFLVADAVNIALRDGRTVSLDTWFGPGPAAT
jgi:1,5-anhydro-D-fructose reductase (1,5-anhydro-D-mannitol-forming)